LQRGFSAVRDYFSIDFSSSLQDAKDWPPK
jgi:hypothetical protein